MKKIHIIALATLVSSFLISSCKNDHVYPAGQSEFENYYYLGFLPWNNTVVSVNRTAGVVKLPVEFRSAFTRDYDADATYIINTAAVVAPAIAAVPGQDFDIVDKNGAVIAPVNGKYVMTFPQALRKTDTIYVKLLNNPTPGTRQTQIDIVLNQTDKYTVGIFSDAFKRPIQIK